MTDNALALALPPPTAALEVPPQATERPASQHPVTVYLASLSEASKRPQRHALDTAAAILTSGHVEDALAVEWSDLRYQHVQVLRARLSDDVQAERLAPATANRVLSAVRRVLLEAWRLGQMTQEDYARAVDVKTVQGERLPAGRYVDEGERRALWAICAKDTTPAGRRDAALLGVLYAGGLRRAEVAALILDDYNATEGSLHVRHGKRNKERLTYLEGGAAAYLADWLRVRGDWPGSLFTPVTPGGGILRRPLSTTAIYAVLERRAHEAGILTLTPHDCRRSFVSDLLESGADLSVAAGLAGHAKTDTTRRYDRRPEAAKQAAVRRLHVPYIGKR